MIPRRLVLATGNPGKVAELRALVAEWTGVGSVEGLSAFPGVAVPAETATTYEENALAKARAVATATRVPALADDSGLEVEALGGAPGIRSARFAGPDADDAQRVARLLEALQAVPEAARAARFRCVVALAWPDGRALTATGECRGRITAAATGTGGFGYDPVFFADELGTTFATATAAEKAHVSHRARAVRALGARLRRE